MKTNLFLLLIILLLFNGFLFPQEMDVPVDIQCPLVMKIISYDKNLSQRVKDKISIGIIYQEKLRASVSTKDDFLTSFKGLKQGKINGIPVSISAINVDESNIREMLIERKINVLYVAPLRAFDFSVIKDFSKALSILTITGVQSYLEKGISVGIVSRAGRPSILLNLHEAKAEGVEFSSQLIKLSRVID